MGMLLLNEFGFVTQSIHQLKEEPAFLLRMRLCSGIALVLMKDVCQKMLYLLSVATGEFA